MHDVPLKLRTTCLGGCRLLDHSRPCHEGLRITGVKPSANVSELLASLMRFSSVKASSEVHLILFRSSVFFSRKSAFTMAYRCDLLEDMGTSNFSASTIRCVFGHLRYIHVGTYMRMRSTCSRVRVCMCTHVHASGDAHMYEHISESIMIYQYVCMCIYISYIHIDLIYV